MSRSDRPLVVLAGVFVVAALAVGVWSYGPRGLLVLLPHDRVQRVVFVNRTAEPLVIHLGGERGTVVGTALPGGELGYTQMAGGAVYTTVQETSGRKAVVRRTEKQLSDTNGRIEIAPDLLDAGP